jgi:hypothetical protein
VNQPQRVIAALAKNLRDRAAHSAEADESHTASRSRRIARMHR